LGAALLVEEEHHHDGCDVPRVPLQLRHQDAGRGAEDGDGAAGADEEAAVGGEG